MTFLIYDYLELEEKASRNLRAWKVLHIILFVLAVIFGLLNYIVLLQTERLVTERDDSIQKCIFYPRELAFHWVELPNTNETIETSITLNDTDVIDTTKEENAQIDVTTTATTLSDENEEDKKTTPVSNGSREKRQAPEEYSTVDQNVTVEESNGIMLIENTTHRYMLDPSRTLFLKMGGSECGFAEFMPLLSAVFAILWTTLFIMCPNGGRTRSGLQESWRILAPAFVFSFLMVILTGHSFTSTNGGLEAFCSAFQNYTNTTTCSAVDPFVALPGNTSWGVGARISATRGASAGVWASWTCACALLLARCLAAADFVVKRTAVHVVRDPQKKVTPYLQKQNSPRRSQRSTQDSPSKQDRVSVRSEPTVTTELVTATVEHEGSQPSSLAVTPLKEPPRGGEHIEMTYTPQERGHQV